MPNTMKRAALYKSRKGTIGYDRIAELVVDDTGVVRVKLLDASDPENLQEALREGVTSLTTRRRVTANDGELFLQALAEYYSNTVSFGFVDESGKSGTQAAT